MLTKRVYFEENYVYLNYKKIFKDIQFFKIIAKRILGQLNSYSDKRFAKYIVGLIGSYSEKEVALGFNFLTEGKDYKLIKEIIDLLGDSIYKSSPVFFLFAERVLEDASDDVLAYFLRKQLYVTRDYLNKEKRQDIGDIQYNELIELIAKIRLSELKKEIYEEAADFLAVEYAYYVDLFTRKNCEDFIKGPAFARAFELILLSEVFPLREQKKLQGEADKVLASLLQAVCLVENRQKNVDEDKLCLLASPKNCEHSILLANFIEQNTNKLSEQEGITDQDKYFIPEYYIALKELMQNLMIIGWTISQVL